MLLHKHYMQIYTNNYHSCQAFVSNTQPGIETNSSELITVLRISLNSQIQF